MWSHPATERLADCAELQLRLLDEWVADGLRAREVGRAKQWLIRGRCFDEDTAAKRLDMRLERALRVGRNAPEPLDRFRDDVRAVTRRTASEAAAQRIQPRDLAIVAVGDRRLLEPALSKLGGVTDLKVRPHTSRL
jgi:predicted Zn-dependent peptidase